MPYPLSFPLLFPSGAGSSSPTPGSIEALRQSQAAAAVGLGSDISTFPDLDVTFALMTDRRVLAEATARRWLTPNGSLWKHPDYGEDVRAYLNAPMTTQKLQDLKTRLEAQAEQDERVQACTVFVSFDDDTKTINIQSALDDGNGEFQFTALVSQLGITDLEVQE